MKQRRKTVATGIFLVLILALGIGYLTKTDEDTGSLEHWICTKGSEAVASISIFDSRDSKKLKFTRQDSLWKGNDGSSYDLSQFAEYVTVFGYMKLEKKISVSPEKREVYGLHKPAYEVSVSYEDGETYKYKLGKYVNNLGLYVMVGDEESVYLVNQQRGKMIQNVVTSLYNLQLTDIAFDEIRGINLFTSEGNMISLNQSEAPRANGDFYWNLFKPYTWTADTKKVNVLIDAVQTISVLKRAEKPVSAEECGLGGDVTQLPSIILYDNYDRKLAIYVGQIHDEYVFCKTNDQEDIYLIDKEILQIINLNSEDMIDTTFYYYEVPSVEMCTVLWQDKSYELRAKWGVINEEGKKGQRYYLGEESMTGAAYKSIAQWFTDTKIKWVGNLPNKQGEELGRITLNRMSPPYEQTFIFRSLPGDKTLVEVEFGQSVIVYIERQSIENLISLLKR